MLVVIMPCTRIEIGSQPLWSIEALRLSHLLRSQCSILSIQRRRFLRTESLTQPRHGQQHRMSPIHPSQTCVVRRHPHSSHHHPLNQMGHMAESQEFMVSQSQVSYPLKLPPAQMALNSKRRSHISECGSLEWIATGEISLSSLMPKCVLSSVPSM